MNVKECHAAFCSHHDSTRTTKAQKTAEWRCTHPGWASLSLSIGCVIWSTCCQPCELTYNNSPAVFCICRVTFFPPRVERWTRDTSLFHLGIVRRTWTRRSSLSSMRERHIPRNIRWCVRVVRRFCSGRLSDPPTKQTAVLCVGAWRLTNCEVQKI